jgi:hypothetical protein
MTIEIQTDSGLMKSFTDKAKVRYSGLLELMVRRHGDNLLEAKITKRGGISFVIKAYDSMLIDSEHAWVPNLQDSRFFVVMDFFMQNDVVLVQYMLDSEAITKIKQRSN